jgi:ABC-type uncharacterized transport system ATPase subunit
MIVGRDVLLRVEKPTPRRSERFCKLKILSVSGAHGEALNKISFNVRAGEIVGVAGIEGNGQTELIEAIAGLVPPAKMSGNIGFSATTLLYECAAAQRTRHRAYPGRPAQTRSCCSIRI